MSTSLRMERRRKCIRLFAMKSIASGTKPSATLVNTQVVLASKCTFRTRETLLSASPTMAKESSPPSSRQGKDGHYRLQGMGERAVRISGKLTLTTSADSGTNIELIVPGRIVFRGPRSGWSTRMKDVFREPDGPNDMSSFQDQAEPSEYLPFTFLSYIEQPDQTYRKM